MSQKGMTPDGIPALDRLAATVPARTRALPLQTWASRRCEALIGERSRM